jgi:UDP-3-O-[3-hydroxymyristoyl] glucosamine N-acyltransferase
MSARVLRKKTYTLEELANIVDGRVHGDKKAKVSGLSTLSKASVNELSFLSNLRYTSKLKTTKASAVLLSEEVLEYCPVNAIVLSNPYLAFAKIARLFDDSPGPSGIIHPSSIIDSSAVIGRNTTINAHVIIGQHVIVEGNVIIGAGTVIESCSIIGEGSHIKSNVSIYHGVKIGKNCIIHANSVIGSDGFGNVKDKQGNWIKVPQLGGVTIGSNVEIGASTTIDRGTLDDTIIADGVRIDNQIQIAHNVNIGENTAIAGLTGIAGSVDIGRNCLIGGQVGISGHLSICDDVVLGASSSVTKTISVPGFYSSNFSVRPHMEWKRVHARISRLSKFEKRLKLLEKVKK